MSPTGVTVVIAVAGFVMSVVSSLIIGAFRAGKRDRDIEYIRRDLALIMSLFELVPRHADKKDQVR